MRRGSAALLWVVISLAGWLWSAVAAHAAPASTLDPEEFPLPSVLEPNVRFWTDVYARYSTDQVVLHDDEHLGVVYQVLELGDLERSGLSEAVRRRRRQDRIDGARDQIVATLRRLARAEPSNAEEERVYRLWDASGGGRARFERAVAHVRAQSGLRQRFAEGVVTAGRYLPAIERTFAAERLPTVLSRLPFVESMFVSRAQSKVGAVGAWQFMPATARLYLQMNPAVDSRLDTVLAAEGAARMLRHDYEELRTWPLALTAYNHGRAGVARAVREVGSRDLGEIVSSYSSRRFGFASRNFYSEFVAAATVHSRHRELFPEVEPDSEHRFDQLELAHYVSLLDLASATATDMQMLRELNPALEPDVFAGGLLAPKAYRLRVPPGALAKFEAAYAGLPPERRRDSQVISGYRVQAGDTLGALARRFDTTVGALQRANGLSRPDRIRVGQELRIPGQTALPALPPRAVAVVASETVPQLPASEPADLPPPEALTPGAIAAARAGGRGALAADQGGVTAPAVTYVVRPGDTLAQISQRYGVTIEELAETNELLSAHRIYPGQRLSIPASGAAAVEARRHVVGRGESLSRIARQYRVSVEALTRRNQLVDSVIHPGQVLDIP